MKISPAMFLLAFILLMIIALGTCVNGSIDQSIVTTCDTPTAVNGSLCTSLAYPFTVQHPSITNTYPSPPNHPILSSTAAVLTRGTLITLIFSTPIPDAFSSLTRRVTYSATIRNPDGSISTPAGIKNQVLPPIDSLQTTFDTIVLPRGSNYVEVSFNIYFNDKDTVVSYYTGIYSFWAVDSSCLADSTIVTSRKTPQRSDKCEIMGTQSCGFERCVCRPSYFGPRCDRFFTIPPFDITISGDPKQIARQTLYNLSPHAMITNLTLPTLTNIIIDGVSTPITSATLQNLNICYSSTQQLNSQGETIQSCDGLKESIYQAITTTPGNGTITLPSGLTDNTIQMELVLVLSTEVGSIQSYYRLNNQFTFKLYPQFAGLIYGTNALEYVPTAIPNNINYFLANPTQTSVLATKNCYPLGTISSTLGANQTISTVTTFDLLCNCNVNFSGEYCQYELSPLVTPYNRVNGILTHQLPYEMWYPIPTADSTPTPSYAVEYIFFKLIDHFARQDTSITTPFSTRLRDTTLFPTFTASARIKNDVNSIELTVALGIDRTDVGIKPGISLSNIDYTRYAAFFYVKIQHTATNIQQINDVGINSSNINTFSMQFKITLQKSPEISNSASSFSFTLLAQTTAANELGEYTIRTAAARQGDKIFTPQTFPPCTYPVSTCRSLFSTRNLILTPKLLIHGCETNIFGKYCDIRADFLTASDDPTSAFYKLQLTFANSYTFNSNLAVSLFTAKNDLVQTSLGWVLPDNQVVNVLPGDSTTTVVNLPVTAFNTYIAAPINISKISFSFPSTGTGTNIVSRFNVPVPIPTGNASPMQFWPFVAQPTIATFSGVQTTLGIDDSKICWGYTYILNFTRQETSTITFTGANVTIEVYSPVLGSILKVDNDKISTQLSNSDTTILSTITGLALPPGQHQFAISINTKGLDGSAGSTYLTYQNIAVLDLPECRLLLTALNPPVSVDPFSCDDTYNHAKIDAPGLFGPQCDLRFDFASFNMIYPGQKIFPFIVNRKAHLFILNNQITISSIKYTTISSGATSITDILTSISTILKISPNSPHYTTANGDILYYIVFDEYTGYLNNMVIPSQVTIEFTFKIDQQEYIIKYTPKIALSLGDYQSTKAVATYWPMRYSSVIPTEAAFPSMVNNECPHNLRWFASDDCFCRFTSNRLLSTTTTEYNANADKIGRAHV